RTACVYDAASNSETCTNADGSRFELVYFDKEHSEFGYLEDPKDIRAARANPASLQRSRIIDCTAIAPFLQGHGASGSIETRFDVCPLLLGYFISRVTSEPDFARAAEGYFATKP